LNPAYRLDGQRVSREAFYATACDPRRHVVVEACAGAGKTWMLVARIVRALLEGAQPQEILAITFTRKAAGEMRERLSQWLASFAGLSPEDAAATLVQFGVAPAAAAARAADLVALHERVLDQARPVLVCTFHAWYAQLLLSAPIDLLAGLGLSPGMAVVEDIEDLRPELLRSFHGAVLDDASLLADFRRLSLRHGRYRLGQWLEAALERRIEVELADQAGTLEPGVGAAADPDAVRQVRAAAFAAEVSTLARLLGQRKGKLAQDAAQDLSDALTTGDDHVAFQALRAALFTKSGSPRKQLGDLPEQARLCDMLDRIDAQIAQQQAHEDHLAMVRLSRTLFARYAALKQRHGLIDMNDLERVALALLSDHTLSAWVQERLDARVRHLLIDEFQDTSPLQWHALQAWLAAYAGAGGGREAPRVFIVGDPKQSIYRFRRAEPRVFVAAQSFVVEALGGTLAACDHTRRCDPGVLGVINQVFAALSVDGALDGWREHTTESTADSGTPAVQRLASAERAAPAARKAPDDERIWRPSLSVPRVQAKALLREAEGGAVARAVRTLVLDEGVAPGDILVLARTRAVLAHAAEALAALHLPHVAPEELRLAESPEAQDLLAVLDVLASPGQSLSLARALKSPLFGASDQDLLQLARAARSARERAGWWHALMNCGAEASAPLQRAARLFAQWSAVADTLPPHDLLDRIVHDAEVLPRLAAAVPPERHARAMESVQALIGAALELDGGRYASPYNFVRALRQRRVLVPASEHADAVRLLTVHGAKGLEARVVFLMDADPQPRRTETAALLVDWPVERTQPARVAFIADEARCPPSLQDLLAQERVARSREEANALYVALTRARQRVIVSRTPPHHSGDAPSWWSRLEPLASPWQPLDRDTVPVDSGQASCMAPLPLRRTRLASPSVIDVRDSDAARLGQAVHRMLEWAARPGAPAREALAAAAALEFAPLDARPVLAIAARILDSASCRRFFDPQTLAWAGNEVPLAGADGQVLRIDRLVKLAGDGDAWWVLDYKLSADPLGDAANVMQLAVYRQAVAALVPGETVRAGFITGDGALIEPI